MSATPQDLIDALDKLTKAVQAAAAKPAGGSGTPRKKKDEERTPFGRALDIGGDILEGTYAAGDLASGNAGRTFRGLRSAYRLWENYGGGGDAGAGGGGGGVRVTGVRTNGGPLAIEGGGGALAEVGAGGGGAGATTVGLSSAGVAAAAVLAVVAVIAGLIYAFKKFKDHVEQTTDELIRDQAKLAEVSGAMAAVYADRELRELQRDRSKGDRLAASAGYLERGEQLRKDSVTNIEVLRTKLSNLFEGAGNRLLAGIYSRFDRAAGQLDRLVDHFLGDEKPEGVAAWVERIEKHEAGRLERAKKRMQVAADRARQPGQ